LRSWENICCFFFTDCLRFKALKTTLKIVFYSQDKDSRTVIKIYVGSITKVDQQCAGFLIGLALSFQIFQGNLIFFMSNIVRFTQVKLEKFKFEKMAVGLLGDTNEVKKAVFNLWIYWSKMF